MEQLCSNCNVALLTESEIKEKYSSGSSGVWKGMMSDFTLIMKDRDRIGVTCAMCGRNFCIACMKKNGKPHPTSGGLACLECGGILTNFKRG